MFYLAFVHTQLLYDIEMDGNATRNNPKKLIIQNNKIILIIRNKPKQYCVHDLYKNYIIFLDT